MEWLIFIIIFVVAYLGINSYLDKQQRAKRREELLTKYDDSELVERLMNKEFWQDQTEQLLLDSLGRPYHISQKVLKTKTRETWKYDKTGKNRYDLKITLENGVVVGWHKK